MSSLGSPVQWILGAILILASIGVITVRKPVHASLCFLLTLLCLAAFYLDLSAEFIAVMQVLVYAGAILVIFMFVIVLFQDAYQQITQYQPKSSRTLLLTAAISFTAILGVLGYRLIGLPPAPATASDAYGTVESLGRALYVDFFFPFEAVTLLFLIAVVGAVYIARRERNSESRIQNLKTHNTRDSHGHHAK